MSTPQALIEATNWLVDAYPTPVPLIERWRRLHACIAPLAAPAGQAKPGALKASIETIGFFLEVLKAVDPEKGRWCEREMHRVLDGLEGA